MRAAPVPSWPAELRGAPAGTGALALTLTLTLTRYPYVASEVLSCDVSGLTRQVGARDLGTLILTSLGRTKVKMNRRIAPFHNREIHSFYLY